MKLVSCISFIGAWLLFAGPVFQSAIELSEERIDLTEADDLRKHLHDLGKPARISVWWWLLPPVAYFKNRRESEQWRIAVLKTIPHHKREEFLSFQRKASGWMIVAMGALCIAIKETVDLVEKFEWPLWLLIPLLLIPFLLSVGFTVDQLQHQRNIEDGIRSTRKSRHMRRYHRRRHPRD